MTYNYAALSPLQLKKRIQALAVRPTEHFLDLGHCLSIFAERQGDQFKTMLDSAGLGKRKAYYLINIAKGLRGHRRYQNRLQKLGWTKCQMIVDQLPRAEFHDLLEFAENHTVKELQNYSPRGGPKAHTRCVLLYFSPRQYRQFEEAVLKFGAKKHGRGLTGKEMAVVRISSHIIGAD